MKLEPQQGSEADFEIIETMLCQNGIRLQALHLDRLSSSALVFGRPFNRVAAETIVNGCIKSLCRGTDFEVCLRLTRQGVLHITSKVYVPLQRYGWVRIADEAIHADNVFRFHQTTRRETYDRLLPLARSQKLDDLLFCNDRGELTEGAMHSVFVKRGNELLTPPLHCGLLPGVYRRFVLESNSSAREELLRATDLAKADAIYLTNSFAGMFPVELQGKFTRDGVLRR